MPYNNSELTIRERAAVLLFVNGIETSPKKLYTIAHPGDLRTVEGLADLPATASRWLRSVRVQKVIASERSACETRKDAERARIEAEVAARNQTSPGGVVPRGFVDYSNPAAQLNKLNELVNTAADSGEALDALKVLLSRQNDLAPEKRTEKRVRAYLPISCTECPLYLRAKTERENTL